MMDVVEDYNDDSDSTIDFDFGDNETHNSPREDEEVIVLDSGDDEIVEIPVPENEMVLRIPRVYSEIEITSNNFQGQGSSSKIEIIKSEEDVKDESRIKLSEDSEEDSETCPICMEAWSNTGKHSLASLKCGHLFGYSCIVKWLQTTNKNKARCPQCNNKAALKDIRRLYAQRLKVLDTSERDQLLEKLEVAELGKNKLDFEIARLNLKLKLQKEEIDYLKKKIVRLESNQSGSVSQQVTQSQPSRLLHLKESLVICPDGGCRVMDYSYNLGILAVSQFSSNNLFSGFGIKKVNALDFRPTQFIFVHSKPIRDIAFHPSQNDLLLSVSLDKCAKLFNPNSNSVVHSFNTETPLWSCCWDSDNIHSFFVGSQNGIVQQFDVRQTNGAICQLNSPTDSSPVTSVASIPPSPHHSLPKGCFIACRLNSCWGYERNNNEYKGNQLPFEGPFVAMCYEKQNEHLLVTSRPSVRHPTTRHMLFNIIKKEELITVNPVHTFLGGTAQTILSRPCQIESNGQSYVVAHQESNSSLMLWSVNTGKRTAAIRTKEPVIDISPVVINDQSYLTTLSDKTLNIYTLS